MKVTFNGWQIVTLVSVVLAAIVSLVAMGQELSALITTGLLVASALGVPIVQGFVNNERVNQVKDLANGNLAAMREEMTHLNQQHAEELARRDAAAALERLNFQQQLAASHEKHVMLAAMLPADSKAPETVEA